jgi:microcystin-dependent protein
MDPFIGEIRIMAYNYPPYQWAQCNGQIMPIQQNTALFSILGTTFGGDGKTTFGLPNFQGRAPMHQGQGPGLTNRVLGDQTGEADETLTASEMAIHSHGLNAQNVSADKAVPAAANYFAKGGYMVGTRAYPVATYSATMTPTSLSPNSISAIGGGQSHPNMQPFLSLNFCIALYGIFPSRG